MLSREQIERVSLSSGARTRGGEDTARRRKREEWKGQAGVLDRGLAGKTTQSRLDFAAKFFELLGGNYF